MKKEGVRTRIEQIGIIPAIRVSSAEDACFAAETVNQGGIPIAEITVTVPGAMDVISDLRHRIPEMIVGAGTVLDIDMAKRCQDAGATFLTSPGFILEVVEFAAKHDVVIFPGALTPTEIITAWKAGADFVKIFPCAPLGGESYIPALTAPLPHVPLIASGGVNQKTAKGFILAGVNVGQKSTCEHLRHRNYCLVAFGVGKSPLRADSADTLASEVGLCRFAGRQGRGDRTP